MLFLIILLSLCLSSMEKYSLDWLRMMHVPGKVFYNFQWIHHHGIYCDYSFNVTTKNIDFEDENGIIDLVFRVRVKYFKKVLMPNVIEYVY